MPRLIKSNYIRTAPIKTDADIIVEIQIIDTDAVFLSVEKNLFPCSSVRQYFLSSDQPLSISCFVINLCCGTVFPSFR